jgi:tRNA_anti-like/YceI-like domain
MLSIVKELPWMFVILAITWIPVVAIALTHLIKRKDITTTAKIIWCIVALIPLVGLLAYGIINYKNKKAILLSTIAAIAITAVNVWYFVKYEPEANRRDVTNEKALTNTAAALIQEFQTNEDAANKKYNNKAVEVSGEVEKIETDASGTNVFLKTGIEGTGISCRLKEKQNVATGSTITVKGILNGFILGEIQLNEAVVTAGAIAGNTPTPNSTIASKPDTTVIKKATTDTAKKTTPQAKTFKSTKGQIKFFSATPAEDIEAVNTQIISTITTQGAVQFAALIKGFRFENELMQTHFNEEKYLNSDKFPKSEFKGNITNWATVNVAKNATYPVTAQGNLTLHGVTKNVTATGTLTVQDGKLLLNSTFKLHVQDYGVDGGEVADKLDITLVCNYQ